MLRTLLDKLHNKNAAIKWFQNNFPEEIIFASVATILETKKAAPSGWSFHRVFQHRGIVIITKNQIAINSYLLSLSAIFYLSSFIFGLIMLIGTQNWDYLIGVIAFGLYTAQFLPYQKQILLKDIQRVKLGSVRRLFTNGSSLTIYSKGKEINIIPVQILSENIIHIISSSNN